MIYNCLLRVLPFQQKQVVKLLKLYETCIICRCEVSCRIDNICIDQKVYFLFSMYGIDIKLIRNSINSTVAVCYQLSMVYLSLLLNTMTFNNPKVHGKL